MNYNVVEIIVDSIFILQGIKRINFYILKFTEKVKEIEWINSDKKTKMCIDKYFAWFAYFEIRYWSDLNARLIAENQENDP